MEVTIDQFTVLADVFGGILETYLEAYRKEHTNDTHIHIEPDDKKLTQLIGCLLEKKCIDDMETTMRYSSSKVLFPDTTFNTTDLERACQLGHLRYAKWLKLNPTQRAVDLAIQGDHADVIEWCISITPSIKINIKLLYKYDAIETAIRLGKIPDMKFLVACKRGSLRIVQHIIVKCSEIDMQDMIDYGFRWACANGHLHVAKWLVSKYPIDVHSADDDAFMSVCANDQLHVAKWLVDNYDINVHIGDEGAFRYACMGGNLEVVKWLVGKYPETKVHAIDDYAFRFACFNDHLEVAKWLLDNYDFPEPLIKQAVDKFGKEALGLD